MLKNEAMTFSLPKDVCNAHLHIIDPSFKNDGKADSQKGTIEEYCMLAHKYHLTRAVFVQAKTFGLDNSCLLDAIKRFGAQNSRGIAVVNNSCTDAELKVLHENGIRGLRFSVWDRHSAVVSFNDCYPLSARIKSMGWHVQLHMSSTQIVQYADVINKIVSNVVIDHMGRLDPKLGKNDPAYRCLCEMIDRGNTWVKLSAPYLNTVYGYPWDDANAIARVIADYAPERVLWGTDFPHITEILKPKIEDLINQIPIWFANEKVRHLALVANPNKLYNF